MVDYQMERLNNDDFFLISIYWIGYTLQPDLQLEFLKQQNLVFPELGLGKDQSRFYAQYELTKDAEPICINEYATQIASAGDHTLVLQIDEWDRQNSSLKLNGLTGTEKPFL